MSNQLVTGEQPHRSDCTTITLSRGRFAQINQRLLDRFFSHVIEDANGCWLWQGDKYTTGYARITVGSRTDQSKTQIQAHRVSYELFVGKIPAGLQIDHLCRVRHCVNPEHLEAVTQHENILRGEAFSAKYARQTHCSKGHPLTDGNLDRWALQKLHARRCRTCKNEWERIRQAKRSGRAAT